MEKTIAALIDLAKQARQLGEREDALRYFRLAIEAAPTLPGPKLEAATELRELGRLDEAEAMAQEALAIAPGNVQAHIILAHCARARGDRITSLGYCQTAAQLSPTAPGPRLEVAADLQELGRFDEAEVEYHRLITMKSENVQAWLGRGNNARIR